jgi:triacylglycerol esterase/lipase EstA (alpha/beta hydrolase family)
VALVAYSFGGLVLKSLVVEARKRVYQKPKNGLDDEIQKCCKAFLNNVKGVVFYGVPHSGATENLSKYFNWQCQQINTINKYFAQLGFSRNLKPFNQQMESLSKEFKDAVHEDLNIYEFGEGLPVDKNWVRFSLYHIESYRTWFLNQTFLYCQNLCGIMYTTLLNTLMW